MWNDGLDTLDRWTFPLTDHFLTYLILSFPPPPYHSARNFFPCINQLKSMARALLEASHTDSPKGMLAAYEAIKAIEEYGNAPIPVKLVPSSPSVKEMSSGGVGLLVSEVPNVKGCRRHRRRPRRRRCSRCLGVFA